MFCAETAYHKLSAVKESKIQEGFRTQNQLAALEENIRSVNAELGGEIDSRTTMQLTLASREKEAADLQENIRMNEKKYYEAMKSICKEYLTKRNELVAASRGSAQVRKG